MDFEYRPVLAENKQRISAIAMIAFLLTIAAPLSRLVLLDRGLLILTIYAAVPFLLIHILTSKKLTLSVSNIQAWFFFMLFWIAVSMLLTHGAITGISQDTFKVQICSIILFCCAINYREEKILNWIYIILAILFIILYLFNSVEYLGGVRHRIELQKGLYLDPNMVAGSFIIPTCLLTKVLLDKNKSVFARVCSILGLLGMLFSSLLGASRGGLIACVACLFVTVFSGRKSGFRRLLFIVFGAVILLLFVSLFVKDNIASSLLQRFTLENMQETGGSGRLNLYVVYLRHQFVEGNFINALFGYGIGTGQYIVGKASHSTPLDFLWGLGIIGFIAYIIFTVKIMKYCIKSKSDIAIACIIGVEVWSLFLSLSNQFPFWAFLFYCVATAKNSYYMNEKKPVIIE